MMRAIHLMAVCIGVAGCSSQIHVRTLDQKLAATKEVNGIPFRVPKRYEAKVYQKTPNGYEPLTNAAAPLMVTVPDPKQLYVLEFEGQVFSNGSVDLTLNADSTIQKLSLSSENKGPAALMELGKQVSAVATAEQARAKASTDASTAAAAASTTSANTNAANALAADKAKLAADLAALQHQIVRSDSKSTPVDILKAEQAERIAKLEANEKARVIGREPYFPDVFPQ